MGRALKKSRDTLGDYVDGVNAAYFFFFFFAAFFFTAFLAFFLTAFFFAVTGM
jgi:hypothetical protein